MRTFSIICTCFVVLFHSVLGIEKHATNITYESQTTGAGVSRELFGVNAGFSDDKSSKSEHGGDDGAEKRIEEFWLYLGMEPAPVEDRIPNIAHFFFTSGTLTILDYLSVKSSYENGKPEKIIIHVVKNPDDSPMWELIKPMVNKVVIETPVTHMFNKELVKEDSADDVYRMAVLSREGGIAVGRHTIQLLQYDCILAAPSGAVIGSRNFEDTTLKHVIGSSLIASTPNHKFVQKWFGMYKRFPAYNWFKLAGPASGYNYADYKKTVFPSNSGPDIAQLILKPTTNVDVLDPALFCVQMTPHSEKTQEWAIPTSSSATGQTYQSLLREKYTMQKLLPNPFFSIVMDCLDKEALKPIYESLEAQTFQLWEVVIRRRCVAAQLYQNHHRLRHGEIESPRGVWQIETSTVFFERTFLTDTLDSLNKMSDKSFVKDKKNITFIWEGHDGSKEPKTEIAPVIRHSSDALSDCSVDLRGNKPVLDTINVVPVTSKSPTVLCYVLCNAAYHDRARIIKETWGSRCDRFIVASDEDDEELGAIAIKTKTPHSWLYLWDKHRELIRYLYNNNIAQQYDWIFKADTDTYVIPENLKNHLSQLDMSKPQIVGCKFSFPIKVRGNQTGGFDLLPRFEEYFEIQKEEDKWQYASGAGFAMNMDFLDKFMSKIDEDRCSPNLPRLSEDFGCAACVSTSYPLSPASSRDKYGREMYHIWAPLAVTTILSSYPKEAGMYWWHENHIPPHNPVPLTGTDSYSRESVLWHRIDDQLFYYMFNQLYKCRIK